MSSCSFPVVRLPELPGAGRTELLSGSGSTGYMTSPGRVCTPAITEHAINPKAPRKELDRHRWLKGLAVFWNVDIRTPFVGKEIVEGPRRA
jgi:hypothetical protein